ncbi:5588_t:CDS:2 [Funneliformis mosseae]|uniref:5588_t:CDS:1 n=1 Tax=Funneliformis mosseae TaxID=27381 RepID=A0A9N9BAL2_FUNMO|nr:5588_t:CDS:2 [Funneliformis mosseae]
MGNETYLNTAARYIETQQLTSKCQHLLRYLDSDGWCKKCTMKSVSSGHLGIDKFIKRTQSKANNCRLDGFTMTRKSRMQCPRSDAITVALKRIKDSQEMTDGYIKRLKSYYRCSLSSKKREQSSLKFYGLTRDPSNGEYMLVIQYTAHGNLRTLLNTNFSSFQWSEKIWWLCDIASSLLTIHKSGHVHGNIHPGNILQLGINQRETSLALDCCNTNPSSRPNAKELLYVFSDWWKCINNTGDKLYQVQKAFMDADEVLPMLELVKMNTRVKNSDAFYTNQIRKLIMPNKEIYMFCKDHEDPRGRSQRRHKPTLGI